MLSNRWAILTALFVARISMGFQFQSIASVTPFIIDDLGFSYVEIGTLIGVFMLPGVFLALPGGYLGQSFGDKRICWFGMALMAVGGLVLGVSESYAWPSPAG
jgi:predicted MFS family arabinose efflux permease